jgi:hypothetical protein
MADKTNGQGTPGPKRGRRTSPTKMDMVRDALAHFGKKAKPAQMKPYIKDTFGVDMSTDHISTYKGNILRKKGGRKKPGPGPKGAQAAVADTVHRGPGRRPSAVSFHDLNTVKDLLGRVGARELRSLIDLLA